jgi:hypothetical protein
MSTPTEADVEALRQAWLHLATDIADFAEITDRQSWAVVDAAYDAWITARRTANMIHEINTHTDKAAE